MRILVPEAEFYMDCKMSLELLKIDYDLYMYLHKKFTNVSYV